MIEPYWQEQPLHPKTIACYAQWYAHFVGVLPRSKLQPRYTGEIASRRGLWAACPCGGTDHHAWVPWEMGDDTYNPLGQRLGSVLTCFSTGQQWLLETVAHTVRLEELSYLILVAQAHKIVTRVVKKRGWSEETIKFLKDTHGIDRELAEEIKSRLGV